ncbi:MAG: glycosyltransferase [Phycisphaeraceae bacterium]|nr:glycosyltransferase [Phycisphaeraceae bacterium]
MSRFSVIIATRNRAAALRETLRALPADAEVLVVDNASTDLTGSAVRDARPDATLIRLDENLGPTAKQIALERATREYVVALDDDCAPLPESWGPMERRLDTDRQLACAGFGVRLPGGQWECGALPRVFVGAAVAFRREALLGAGGYDRRLFMQAEEYDIVYRLAARGWECAVFHDLVAIHRKHQSGRRPSRTIYLDARNNISQALRYLPAPWRAMYAKAWTERYLALGRTAQSPWAARRGVLAAHAAPSLRSRRTLDERIFDDLFGRARIEGAFRRLHASGVRRVVFATLGKNIPMYLECARRVGVRVEAIADDRFVHAGIRWCMGTPLLESSQARTERFDAVVVSNSAPLFAHETARRWRTITNRPVYAFEAIDPERFACDVEHRGLGAA